MPTVKAPQAAKKGRPLSPPSATACALPDPRRGSAAGGLLSTFLFLGCLSRLLNLGAAGSLRELNAALATATGDSDDLVVHTLDVPLLKRTLRRADASDEEIYRLVIFAAADVEAAENRALLSNNEAAAAEHWATADELRRRAGVPEMMVKSESRRRSL